ncbi:MAG: Zn-ribbon domain-containing OB-fold protein [Acidimicrobiales bacterium]
MSVLRPQVDGIPAPRPSLASAPYWEGCRARVLRFQRCPGCLAIQTHPSAVCWRCHRPGPEWLASSGRASLYSWTVVWRAQHPAFEVPYAPAVVELAEGPRIVSAVVGCEPSALLPGLALEVVFHPVDGEITLPFFRPVRAVAGPRPPDRGAQAPAGRS